MSNIAFFEISKEEKKYIKQKIKGHTLQFFEQPIQDVEISEFKDAEIISVFIYSKINKNVLNKLKALKFVTTRSTGFDHVDIMACDKKKIVVANVPFYGENTVAEHTFGLILSLSRKIHKSYLRTIENNFDISDLQGFDLQGKTLGVIGTGHIGLHVIRIAKGFGMHVKAFDVHKNVFISDILHYNYVSIDEILKTCDIITLHMPDNKYTHHFLNAENLPKTKKGVIIINTSRGGLIDTPALYDLLKKGHIGGVGLDVIEGEELVKEEQTLLDDSHADKLRELFRNKEIFKMDNVIFTPHNAFNSKEAVQRIIDTSIENIEEFLSSKKLSYQVMSQHH